MIDIGYRPIIWHLMRYYAHFGHKEFILCLGYRSDVIKNYFLHYNECLSNDFVLAKGGRDLRVLRNDIDDWTITFVDTGLASNIGQRLCAVQPYSGDDDVFMANYADGLTDLNLAEYLEFFYKHDKVASFLSVQPSQSFHVVSMHNDGLVSSIQPVQNIDLWINGGFFAFRKELFNYIRPGEELVVEPFQRLIVDNQLVAYRNPGFWACMDTYKEKKMFDDMYARGEMPWALWQAEANHEGIRLNDEHPRSMPALVTEVASLNGIQA